jgi:hypothetical protein
VERRILNRSQWFMANAGNAEFKTVIPGEVYRLQVCQQTAATGINNELMVYCAPGAHAYQNESCSYF